MLISSSSALTVDLFLLNMQMRIKVKLPVLKKSLLITKQTCKPVRLAHMAEKLHGGANK